MRHAAWLWSAALALVLVACGSEDGETGSGGAGGDGGSATGVGGTGTGQGGSAGGAGGSGGGAVVVQESEPNDGATETEYDDLALDEIMEGAVGSPGDIDIFRLPTTGATPYQATLTPSEDSTLVPHLTVIDDGRGGDAAGQDYVKIVRAASGAVSIQWMAMGEGGYFIAVQDARNVDDDNQSLGDETFTYRITASQLTATEITIDPLPTVSGHAGALAFPGAIDLFTFSGTAGQDALIDMQADGDLDGRLFIVAASTADWIARNDDRVMGDNDPLIDAPLTEGGDLTLVVESIAESPTDLGYGLTASVQ